MVAPSKSVVSVDSVVSVVSVVSVDSVVWASCDTAASSTVVEHFVEVMGALFHQVRSFSASGDSAARLRVSSAFSVLGIRKAPFLHLS